MMPTDMLPAIETRRSIRKFDNRPVEKEKIKLCLQSAFLAPSAENVQPWRFILLDDPARRDSFHKAAFRGLYRPTKWAENAPLLVALITDTRSLAHQIGGKIQSLPFHYLDAAMAGEHLVLQAQALGLATCWIGWFDVKKARKALQLPRTCKLCSLIALGYPHPDYRPRYRKLREPESLVFSQEWGKKWKF